MSDDALGVNRWRRYGHDRLYVLRADESKVGWWDLKTGEAHPEDPVDLAVLTAAVVAWQAEQPTGSSEAVAKPAGALKSLRRLRLHRQLQTSWWRR